MTGIPLIIAFVCAIVLMIVMISKLKIHPFISIMLVSLALGLVGGIPLVNATAEDGTAINGIATVIGQGFSGTFTSIGIVIILGALVGAILEATGGAFKLADMVIKLVGEKHPEIAMAIMGWVVSIPVFCDSGFVILNPIRKAIVQRTAASSVMLTVALSAGLFISHNLVPPTPGPIAAAGALGLEDNLLLVIGIGILVSILPLIAGIAYARYIGARVKAKDETDPELAHELYEQIMKEVGKLPSGLSTLAPIIVPILLMALGSIANMAGWTGMLKSLCTFFGTPIIALSIGVVFAVFTLSQMHKLDSFYDLVQDTLKTVGPILFITAAGGVLGKVIASTDMVQFISDHANAFDALGIFFPFLLAAILKTAQGSSTVAITTTAGILGPLMATLGYTTPIGAALVVAAIGCGAMTVSHANDSYFWVVTSFGGMEPEQGYKTQSAVTGLMGVAGIIGVFVLSLVFGI
ncbi:GntP family permease [Slackia exigua]|uniref:GntP family permease n=1 Tax=Slackia exigua TaxID=84109 RepID=UPI00200470AD|nr:GntP family permease [Slackia exigua]